MTAKMMRVVERYMNPQKSSVTVNERVVDSILHIKSDEPRDRKPKYEIRDMTKD